jgi:two-component system LytT family response regulator
MGFSFHEYKPILVKTWKGIQKINPAEILLVKADLQGIIIELTNNRQCECPQSLTEINAHLEKYSFFRIHRKFLINMDYVVEYIKDKETIIIENGDSSIEIPVSRRKRKLFIETWKEFSMKEQDF